MFDDASRDGQSQPGNGTALLRAAAVAARGASESSANIAQGARTDERRSAERRRLIAFARENAIPVRKFERVEEFETKGSEHAVWLSQPRVRKFTLQNYPAGWTFVIDRQGRPVRLRHAFASEYLERMALQNEFFGDDISLEAVGEDGRFEISQPYRGALLPTIGEIHLALSKFGFEEALTQSDSLFFRHPEGLVVGDEKPQNWSKSPDGLIIPIDLIIVDTRSDS